MSELRTITWHENRIDGPAGNQQLSRTHGLLRLACGHSRPTTLAEMAQHPAGTEVECWACSYKASFAEADKPAPRASPA